MSRICEDVECVNCGKVFRQSRWWQVACSERCRVIVNNNRTSELRNLTRGVKELENRVKQAEIEAAQYYEDH